jgi:hypothetical protein
MCVVCSASIARMSNCNSAGSVAVVVLKMCLYWDRAPLGDSRLLLVLSLCYCRRRRGGGAAGHVLVQYYNV